MRNTLTRWTQKELDDAVADKIKAGYTVLSSGVSLSEAQYTRRMYWAVVVREDKPCSDISATIAN